MLERPGSFAAWSVLLAVAIYWLSSAIGGLAHGSTFRDTVTHTAAYSGLNARQRLDAFFGVGYYVIALALLLALGLALLVPTKDERDVAVGLRSGAPSGGGRTAWPTGADRVDSRTSERASRRLLLVLTLAGLVVAFAALVTFISDLSHAGAEPDASLQGAVQDLAAIPVALVVALWGASRINEWPAWARVAPPTSSPGAERRRPAPDGFAAGEQQNRPGPDLAEPPATAPAHEEVAPPPDDEQGSLPRWSPLD
jgi:hypothetical protein